MTTTKTVRSDNGTTIAYETRGSGPALVLVDGAFGSRGFGPNGKLAELLAERFTVLTYDRRGRGESGDTAPYRVEREVEDLAPLLDAAGGRASLFGISSGAALALEAAAVLPGVERLVVYEAPFIVDDQKAPIAGDYIGRVEAALAAGRRGDAVKLFMREAIEMPAPVVALMRVTPVWSKLKAVVHTLPYDLLTVEEHQQGKPLSAARWSSVTVPTLVIDGGKSPAWMRNGMRSLAELLPDAEYRTLEGQTHMVKPKVLALVLTEYLERPLALAAAGRA